MDFISMTQRIGGAEGDLLFREEFYSIKILRFLILCTIDTYCSESMAYVMYIFIKCMKDFHP